MVMVILYWSGFFKLRLIAVIYDAMLTLRSDTIFTYYSKLTTGRISIPLESILNLLKSCSHEK